MARIAPGKRAEYRAFVELPTRWHDNDAYGHLNNAIYYALFDTALSQWQNANGLPIVGPDAYRFVVVENGCRYHFEAAFPDLIHCGLRLAHIGNSSFRYEVGLFRNDETIACAEGFFTQVHTSADNRPSPLPDAARKALETLLP
ncbi:acyl-CoA thioesterase [Primorskyibacter flagellatus]|uniref:acyl-CoA thioesterase n=1 Tax=Primorskyibacter flagellatus TaxID=1387277 RepID=UPI003A91B28C